MSCSQVLLECGLDLEIQINEGWLGMSNSHGSGRKNSSRTNAARAGRRRCQGLGQRGPMPLTAGIRAGNTDIQRMSLAHPQANMHVRATRYEVLPLYASQSKIIRKLPISWKFTERLLCICRFKHHPIQQRHSS